MMSLLAPLMLLALTGPNMLSNPSFDDGLKGWRADSAEVKAEAVKRDGRTAIHITIPPDASSTSHSLYQDVSARPGEVYMARAEAMRKGIRDGRGAVTRVEYYDAAGKLLFTAPADYTVAENFWTPTSTPLHRLSVSPEGTARVRFHLFVQGRGEVWFDNVSLCQMTEAPQPPLNGPVTLSVTKNVVCKNLFGFGAEDDGWFNDGQNLVEGVNEADNALREKRIRWINPSWVRTFVWTKEFCPSGDWKTFTFESPGMKSRYRSLEVYQKIGARIDITGAEWEAPGNLYDDPERVARGWGELMEYMIKKKGFTNIKYWTLTNEPDGAYCRMPGASFDLFIKIHQAMRKEFKRRGLDVKIVGSDDANSTAFYTTCVKNPEYFKLADILCSHVYVRKESPFAAAGCIDHRMGLAQSQKPVKPFIIGECGFLEKGYTSHVNHLMPTYPYALWMSDLVIEGLNRGVAGFAVWTMNEMYYPNAEMMQFGLWSFKDKGWKPRPVYYLWANLCRNTKPGDKVFKVETSNAGAVRGAVVGRTLFWVNRSDKPAEVIVKGLAAKEARILEEKTLQGDEECGVVVKMKNGRFTAPPKSFGTAR